MKPDDKESGILKQTLSAFAQACAAKQPVPGGGAVACYTGALGAALAEMAIAYSIQEDDPDRARRAGLNEGSDSMQELRESLQRLAEEDSQAYNRYSDALKLPRESKEEKAIRKDAIHAALREALKVPLEGAARSLKGLEQLAALAGMVSSRLITDVGVAALCLDTALKSCWYNVIINVKSLKDKSLGREMAVQREDMEEKAERYKKTVSDVVEAVLKDT